jgi:hypothetical protein
MRIALWVAVSGANAGGKSFRVTRQSLTGGRHLLMQASVWSVDGSVMGFV